LEGIPQGLKPASVALSNAKAKALAYLEAKANGAFGFPPAYEALAYLEAKANGAFGFFRRL
jgi:hypothetical protein